MTFTPEGAPVIDKRYIWFLKVRVLEPFDRSSALQLLDALRWPAQPDACYWANQDIHALALPPHLSRPCL